MGQVNHPTPKGGGFAANPGMEKAQGLLLLRQVYWFAQAAMFAAAFWSAFVEYPQ